MEMRVLLLLFFLLHLLAIVAVRDCLTHCGNVSIPYPFGIGEGCSLSGFNISCNATVNGTYKPYIFNVEVINISIVAAEMRVYNPISFACYDNEGNPLKDHTFNAYLNLSYMPYRFSTRRNKFTAIGCDTLAYINDPNSKSPYMSGCLSVCQNQAIVRDKAPCSGLGCCQTLIPEGLSFYKVRFDPGFNHVSVWDFNPCSYAFLGEENSYEFRSSDVHMYDFYYKNNRHVPIVLDWAIRNEKCDVARLNKTGTFTCVGANSECIDSTNGPGYTCNCSKGYEGNPYIIDGCNDIDECDDFKLSGCYGKCANLPGNYSCFCPSGTDGDPRTPRGCQRKISLPVKLIIAGLCIFLVAAVMYVVYEKAKLIRAKQICFRQNGGLLLQQQINAHRCVRFKIFSAKEIGRATNNFDARQVKGRGGQGIVYEGTLDDRRKVAVKKSIMIDEKKKTEFAKEMYILSLINHKNVVQILGCCLEVEVPILVYEFISRGTLYQQIQNKNQIMPLGFRLKIAIDSASALAYLHSDASPAIIHGDIKSSNILLDDKYMAKISDFGASMLPQKDIDETGVPGTYGYLDPESLQTGRLTEKSDVYSFAVVILELLTRKKAVYLEGSGEKKNLAQTFERSGLEEILDDEIRHEITEEQTAEFEKLLRVCLSAKGGERPTMTKVVAWLRRTREFDQKLEECNLEYKETVHGDSTCETQYYTSERQAAFGLDYSLTR